jgi:ABC-type Fe3+-siderophore transport system permease subunit
VIIKNSNIKFNSNIKMKNNLLLILVIMFSLTGNAQQVERAVSIIPEPVSVNYAVSTGLNTKRARILIISISAIITGTVTAFTGPIAFVGVVIPHFARAFFRTVNHKTVLPATILLGSILMLVCDIVSQLPVSNRTLPINAVSAMFGAPMIIWIVLKRKKL